MIWYKKLGVKNMGNKKTRHLPRFFMESEK